MRCLLPLVVLATVAASGVSGEQICSVCCWEDDTTVLEASEKTCRVCVHDLNTCPGDGPAASSLHVPEPFLQQRPLSSAPRGHSVPNELIAPPSPSWGSPPGSQRAAQAESIVGPPADNTQSLGAPGSKAGGIVLPEGPEEVVQYLQYASKPGTNPGPPAYGSAPAPNVPGWKAYAPGKRPDEVAEGAQSLRGASPKPIAIAFSASTTRRTSARRDTVVPFGSVLTNADSGATNREKSFDVDSGEFTCHVPGLYFFSVNVKKIRGHHTMKLNIMKNDDVITPVESSSYSDAIGATSIVHLDATDKVYLRLSKRYSIDKQTSFNGYLIYAD